MVVIIRCFVVLTLVASPLFAQMNPHIAWDAGIPGGIPDVAVKANVMDYGAKADGVSDDSAAIQRAIDAIDNGAVLIPEGKYALKSGLQIGKGGVLRGEGADKTRLLFDISDGVAIDIIKYGRGPWVDLEAGYQFGSDEVKVADGKLFQAGNFVEIQQENDSEVMYTNPKWAEKWSKDSVGQILKVKAVNGKTLVLDKPLYHSFRTELNPQIRTQDFVERAGVEDLYIKLTSKGDPITIQIKNAAYCWVRNIESEFTSRNHVGMTSSYRCEVRDSYFHNSYEFGGGGHGYGVNMGHHVTDCLVENNIFRRLRHSMLVQVGACGNVFGYNYSIEPKSDGNWTPCDISLHGHFPFMNLFESNVVQEIDVSDYWGPVGPGNTFLRNRVEAEGIDVLDHSHGQNVVGNELGSGENVIRIHKSVNRTFVSGNYVNGDKISNDKNIPSSYCHKKKPDFFGPITWPITGADLIPNAGKIPAQRRFEERVGK